MVAGEQRENKPRLSRFNLWIQITAICSKPTITKHGTDMAAHTSHRNQSALLSSGADNLFISEAVHSPNQFSCEEETNHMDKTSWVTESFYSSSFLLSLPNRWDIKIAAGNCLWYLCCGWGGCRLYGVASAIVLNKDSWISLTYRVLLKGNRWRSSARMRGGGVYCN